MRLSIDGNKEYHEFSRHIDLLQICSNSFNCEYMDQSIMVDLLNFMPL